jgi:hypothetical protein
VTEKIKRNAPLTFAFEVLTTSIRYMITDLRDFSFNFVIQVNLKLVADFLIKVVESHDDVFIHHGEKQLKNEQTFQN